MSPARLSGCSLDMIGNSLYTVTISETKFPIWKQAAIREESEMPVSTGSLTRRGFVKAGLGAAAAAALPGAAQAQQAQQAQRERLSCVISSATFEPGTAPLTSLPDALGFWSSEGLEV